MRKTWFIAICAMVLIMMSCNNSGKARVDNEDDTMEEETDSLTAEEDATPMPMFVFAVDSNYLQVHYWTYIEEPLKDEDNADYFDSMHSSWALQESFRRHRSEYTNLLSGGKTLKVKYVDELLKDPNGNTPSIGELHGRVEIPALGARFLPVGNNRSQEYEYGGVIVTDSYLKSHRRLDIETVPSSGEQQPPMPSYVVEQLEKQYGMKASRSLQCCVIDHHYLQGIVQFEGEYKIPPKDEYDHRKSLALEVLVDSSKVYACEILGYYDESDGSCGWNVDDEGEYIPCDVSEAFEGKDGLELCYKHFAPESCATGLFLLRKGKYTQLEYEIYHVLIDEDIPVWNTDIAE